MHAQELLKESLHNGCGVVYDNFITIFPPPKIVVFKALFECFLQVFFNLHLPRTVQERARRRTSVANQTQQNPHFFLCFGWSFVPRPSGVRPGQAGGGASSRRAARSSCPTLGPVRGSGRRWRSSRRSQTDRPAWEMDSAMATAVFSCCQARIWLTQCHASRRRSCFQNRSCWFTFVNQLSFTTSYEWEYLLCVCVIHITYFF